MVTLSTLSLHGILAAGTGNQLPMVIVVIAIFVIGGVAAALALKKS
jgi:hypothetical protein